MTPTHSKPDLNAVETPTRREMLTELLIREDLLSSCDWPWTTAQIREAYEALQEERYA
jgi:hypothetical protein